MSSKAEKWTPGPWEAKKGAGWYVARPDAAARRESALAVGMTPADSLVHAPKWIDDAQCDAECEANAHLIAAAPDLYEALEDMLWPIAACCQKPTIARCMCAKCVEGRARAALALARGEEPAGGTPHGK